MLQFFPTPKKLPLMTRNGAKPSTNKYTNLHIFDMIIFPCILHQILKGFRLIELSLNSTNQHIFDRLHDLIRLNVVSQNQVVVLNLLHGTFPFLLFSEVSIQITINPFPTQVEIQWKFDPGHLMDCQDPTTKYLGHHFQHLARFLWGNQLYV